MVGLPLLAGPCANSVPVTSPLVRGRKGHGEAAATPGLDRCAWRIDEDELARQGKGQSNGLGREIVEQELPGEAERRGCGGAVVRLS